MMTEEKTELPSDAVSLPPNYAPSEAFTDSPPPAYRRPGQAAVKVAKIICVTLLMMTFIVGFFIVTHKYMQQNNKCDCSEQIVSNIRHAALFSHQAPKLQDISNDIAELPKTEDDQSLTASENQEEELIEPQQILDIFKKQGTESEDELIEEMQKNIKLPIDLLLGNPKLAGRNVACKVQKKQQKLAEGIIGQAIIVTCGDEDSAEESEDTPMLLPPGMRQMTKPPMSLLGNIMKILASRPKSSDNMPSNRRPIPLNMRPMPFPMSRPMFRPQPGQIPRGFPGPINSGMIHLVPIKRIQMEGPSPMEMIEGRSAPRPMIMSSGRQLPPFLRDAPPQVRAIMGMPNPMSPPIPPHMLFNQRRHMQEMNNERPPFHMPFGSGPMPVRVIRLPFNEVREQDREEDLPGPLPPFHPLMNLIPGRRARIIRLRPKTREEEMQQNEPPMSFPFPGRLLPLQHRPEFPQQMSNIEASGRAIPAPPVDLPDVRVMQFPFRPQPFIPEARVTTEMEVQAAPPQKNEETFNSPIVINENEDQFTSSSADFGPPKTHTVIESAPESIFEDKEQPLEVEPELQEHESRSFVPESDRYSPGGRVPPLFNLDAEEIPDNENIDSIVRHHRMIID